ncbi:hypothetical protein [Acidisoma cladoniae]|uniref:hypothetical protein n=1 Tax=Acidisoma cladoniae TaxID=3040935 RepID=UPI00254E0697|nr:hypothetical protein [Acidisoma sp. PAMC 29798]
MESLNGLFRQVLSTSESIGAYKGDPLYHASLDPTEYEALLSRSGFTVVAHVVKDPQAGGRTAWLAQRAPRYPGG